MARKPRIDRRAIEKHVKEIAKDYERAARRNPIRVPVKTEGTAEGGSVTSGDPVEGNPILARLLLWLGEHAQLNPSHYVNVSRFVEEQQLHGEDASVLAFELEQREFVRVARTFDSTPHVYLTEAGHAAIHRLKKLRQDRAARLRYTMDAFLRWLFDTASDQKPVSPTAFLDTPSGSFAGEDISPEELRQALAYLSEHDLIEFLDTDPRTVAITPQGVTCALAGGSVQAHTNQPSSGDNNITFHIGENTGNIAANSRDFTMNATTNKDGIDPAAVVMLARALRQAAPVLELPEEDALEFTQLATRLETEAVDGSPDPGRLQRWGGSIVGILNSPVVNGALGSVLAAYAGTVLPGLSPA